MASSLIHRTKRSPNLMLILFTFPAIALFCLFVLYPFLAGSYYSFNSWNGIDRSMKFIGIDNFTYILTDERFKNGLIFTMKFTIVSVILQNSAAILLAVILDKVKYLKTLLRGIFFLPNVLAGVVIAFTWTFMFSSVFDSIYKITGIPVFGWSWFGDQNHAFIAILIVAQWLGTGYLMIIYLAGLQTINTAYIEAAVVDGANAFYQFIYIKLPLLMPSIVIGVFLITMNGIKQFDLSFLLTGGGPANSTTSLVLYIYNTAYSNHHFGAASAQALVLFAMVLLVTFTEIFFLKKREVEA